MPQDAKLIAEIERVLAKYATVQGTWHASNMAHGFTDTASYYALVTESVALVDSVYGANHPQAAMFRATIANETLYHLKAAEGILRGTVEAVQHGLLNDIRTQMLLDVQNDFLDAAKAALERDAKDVAAALSCVVLEDSVKRLATKSGHEELCDKEFTVAVAKLFNAGVITKSTKGSLLAHTDLRNSALHAQWHEVSSEAVQALLYLLPVFIEQHGV